MRGHTNKADVLRNLAFLTIYKALCSKLALSIYVFDFFGSYVLSLRQFENVLLPVTVLQDLKVESNNCPVYEIIYIYIYMACL